MRFFMMMIIAGIGMNVNEGGGTVVTFVHIDNEIGVTGFEPAT